MRRVVYTAIIGSYDSPPRLDSGVIDKDCDYLCFSDEDIELPLPWQLRRIERLPAGAAATNRRVKFCAHEFLSHYDQALYLDGNVDLKRFPSDAFAALDEAGCVLIAHPQRRSVREEMLACILAGKLALGEALTLVAAQTRAGFDEAQELTANRLFARRLSDVRINHMFEVVFGDYLRGPPRDQLHLQHALQRMGISPIVMPRQWASDTFTIRSHSGVDPRRGRLFRVLRRLMLGPLVRGLLELTARINRKEMHHHD
jgi:hypothetical protein